jgi:hypothetical protein
VLLFFFALLLGNRIKSEEELAVLLDFYYFIVMQRERETAHWLRTMRVHITKNKKIIIWYISDPIFDSIHCCCCLFSINLILELQFTCKNKNPVMWRSKCIIKITTTSETFKFVSYSNVVGCSRRGFGKCGRWNEGETIISRSRFNNKTLALVKHYTKEVLSSNLMEITFLLATYELSYWLVKPKGGPGLRKFLSSLIYTGTK